MFTLIVWIAGVIILSASITLAARLLNSLVTNWSHTKRTLEDSESEATAERLNYYHIAYLERQLFGQAFHNPDCDNQCKCDTCRFKPLPIDPQASDEYKYGLPSWGDREGE